ncbi:hypothetical protein [Pseudomonas fluorescens]|uniref:hypothetical protein n=1 Tax=Pseudomonas fluorescens TaxID=294 RepID=UPI0011D1DA28|nr:hypothetical protein [Pseudomonas fluorescens]
MRITIISVAFAAPMILGCTYSQKNVDEIGKYADQGDYVAVAFRSTVGVVVSGLVDVVSLGGALTPDQAQEAWAPVTQPEQAWVPVGATDDIGSAVPAPGSVSTSEGTDVSAYGAFDDSKYKPGIGCEKNLSYLSSRLRKFSPDMINDVRKAILSTNMMEVMSTINKQGLSPQVAVQQALQQADAFDRTAAEALSTAEQVDAFGTTDAEFEKKIKSGRFTITGCSGIRDSALCTAIINKYGAISNRAVAANLMCFKRTNQWAL